jgi:pyrroloquinoline quinone (PQQ) biosynthesis protein C
VSIRRTVEIEYAKQTDALSACKQFQALETGRVEPKAYDDFIANVCKTHLRSPQILAFLFSVAPPAAVEHIKHNMLEELGLDDEGIAHPNLLIQLAEGAGFNEACRKELELLAQDELRRLAAEPLLYGTVRELGFSALLETVAFEWMLSRLASRMARFLEQHRKLPKPCLEWFTHHSELDIRHAEDGLDSIDEYARYYEIDLSHFALILELTFRENVFIKRYFGELVSARQAGMIR